MAPCELLGVSVNLIDAVKSGRPFRRHHWIEGTWSILDEDGDLKFVGSLCGVSPQKEDILADDWEIQEPTVTITWSQLKEAYRGPTEPGVPFDLVLARRLGLEP